MTITNEKSEVVYEGNSAATEFSFDFLIPEDALQVLISDGSSETKLAESEYSITGLGNENGGAVTYHPAAGPLASDNFIIIQRALPLTQPVTLENQQAFFPSVVGGALDRAVMQIQQLQTAQGRFVQITRGSNATPASAFADLMVARDEALTAAQQAEAAENSLLKQSGNWTTSTAYRPGEIVQQNGSSYVCLLEHTSNNFQTDLEADRWELFAAAGENGSGSGDMLAANNLSDVADVPSARSNLGLGTSAVLDASDLTKAQAENPADTTFGRVSGERLGQAVAANAIPGLAYITTNELQGDSSFISVTGLSGYRIIKAKLVAEVVSGGATTTVEARSSGGVWREIGNFASATNSTGQVFVWCLIENFNNADGNDIKTVMIQQASDQSDLDRTGENTAQGDNSFLTASCRSEVWDEVKFSTTSFFEGTSGSGVSALIIDGA